MSLLRIATGRSDRRVLLIGIEGLRWTGYPG
jgi:hypothetical protein